MSIEGLVVGLLAIVAGGAWALYGLKLFVILLPIWAAFFGLTVGAQWAHAIFGDGLFRTALSWIIGIAIGIGFALISYFWYYAAVTLAVGALGYALGVGVLDYLNIDSSFLGLVVGLALGAVFAVATFLLGVPIILVLLVSAITGAAGVVNGLLLIFGQNPGGGPYERAHRWPPDRLGRRHGALDRPRRGRDRVPGPHRRLIRLEHRSDVVPLRLTSRERPGRPAAATTAGTVSSR